MSRPRLIKDRQRFGEHAAPEAISATLADVWADADSALEEIKWLNDLMGVRIQEIRMGAWGAEKDTDG